MTIWMSGELQADVDAGYMNARNEMQSVINAALNGRDYGEGIIEWSLIPMILNQRAEKSTGYTEVKKYHIGKRAVEFRLRIAHPDFKAADDKERRRLIVAMMTRWV